MKKFTIVMILLMTLQKSSGQTSKTFEGHYYKLKISALDMKDNHWETMDLDAAGDFIIENSLLMVINQGNRLYKLLKVDVDLKTKYSTVISWDALDENKQKCQVKLFTNSGSKSSTLELIYVDKIISYKCMLN